MPKSKFKDIFESLKQNILNKKYPDHMLPSEFQLIEEYQCSRNTVRRAINLLSQEGYVQSIKGKGVIILEQLSKDADIHLNINDFAGLRSISIGHQNATDTKILAFKKMIIDEDLAKKTNLPLNKEVYYLERLRYINNHPWVLDINYFLSEVAVGLNESIAKQSIYKHIEETLHTKILGSRRIITIKKATKQDLEVLEIGDLNCVGVILNHAYIENGTLFEYTESHYSPEHFAFQEFSQK